MRDILRSRLVKYFRSPIFYAALIVSAVCGVLNGYYCGYFKIDMTDLIYCPMDDIWALSAMWAAVVCTALCLGREFSDGTLRGKLIAGHSRTAVYAAEAAASALTTLCIFIVNITPTVIGMSYIVVRIPLSLAVKWAAVMLLSFELVNLMTVSVCFIIGSRSFGLVTAFALLFVFYTIFCFTNGYYYNTDPEKGYDTVTIEEDNGEVHEEQMLFYNRYYVDGLAKKLINAEHMLNPLSAFEDAVCAEYIPDKTGMDESTLLSEKRSAADMNSAIPRVLIWSAAAAALGIGVFKRKDLK